MNKPLVAIGLVLILLGSGMRHIAQSKEVPMRYVPFLSREVPVSQLQERVFVTMDDNRKSFGINRVQKFMGIKGGGTEVCVIDTGVDPTHPQLDEHLVAFADWTTGLPGTLPAYDDHGHGTHVSSIAVGDGVGGLDPALTKNMRGVAPKADLSVAKALLYNGSGAIARVILAIEWCAQRETVDVISMSLSTKTPSDGTDPLSEAVNVAVRDYGKVVVVSAGNAGSSPGRIGAPSAAELAITVGAAGEWTSKPDEPNWSGGPVLMPWSSRGPTVDGRIKPDIVGPGHTVLAATASEGLGLPVHAGTGMTPEGYHVWSGTSMSAPFVAGVAALMLSANPGLTPAQVKKLLTETALDLGEPGKDNQWGAGLLNGQAAVAAANGTVQRDIFPAHQTFVVPAATYDAGYWVFKFSSGINTPVAATLHSYGLDIALREWMDSGNAGEIVDIGACGNDEPCGLGSQQYTDNIRYRVMPALSDPDGPRRNYVINVFPSFLWAGAVMGEPFILDLFWDGGEWLPEL